MKRARWRRVAWVALPAVLLFAGCAYQQRLAQGDALLARGDFPLALREYQAAREFPLKLSSADARQKIAEANTRWAADLDRRAAELERADHPGAAWLLAAKAAELDRTAMLDPGRGERLRALIRQAVDYPVAARAADPRAQAALGLLAGKLGSEATLRLELDPAAQTRAILECSIGEPAFEQQALEVPRTASYRAGTRVLANPALPARIAEVETARRVLDEAIQRERDEERRRIEQEVAYDHAAPRLRGIIDDHERDRKRREDSRGRESDERRRRLEERDARHDSDDRDDSGRREAEEARRELDRLDDRRDDAREDWEQAQRRRRDSEAALEAVALALRQTPPEIEEAIIAEHRFMAVRRTLTARATLSGAIAYYDARPAIEFNVPLAVEASALSHAAQPVAGVAARADALPEPSALAGQLPQKAVGPLAEHLRESFRAFRAGILRSADTALTAEERLDHLAAYMLSDPADENAEVARLIDDHARHFAGIEGASRLH